MYKSCVRYVHNIPSFYIKVKSMKLFYCIYVYIYVLCCNFARSGKAGWYVYENKTDSVFCIIRKKDKRKEKIEIDPRDDFEKGGIPDEHTSPLTSYDVIRAGKGLTRRIFANSSDSASEKEP